MNLVPAPKNLNHIVASELTPGMSVNRFGWMKTIATITPGTARGYRFITVTYVDSPEYSTHYLTQLVEVA